MEAGCEKNLRLLSRSLRTSNFFPKSLQAAHRFRIWLFFGFGTKKWYQLFLFVISDYVCYVFLLLLVYTARIRRGSTEGHHFPLVSAIKMGNAKRERARCRLPFGFWRPLGYINVLVLFVDLRCGCEGSSDGDGSVPGNWICSC